MKTVIVNVSVEYQDNNHPVRRENSCWFSHSHLLSYEKQNDYECIQLLISTTSTGYKHKGTCWVLCILLKWTEWHCPK